MQLEYEMREYLVYWENSGILNFKELRIYGRC